MGEYDHPEALKLAQELVAIKFRLGNAGLFRAMHELDHATRALGFEMAEKLQDTTKLARHD